MHLLPALKVNHLELRHDIDVALRLEVELRLLTPRLHLDIVGVTRSLRDRHIGNVRHLEHHGLPLLHYALELLFFFLNLIFHELHFRDKLCPFRFIGRAGNITGDGILLRLLRFNGGEECFPRVVERNERIEVDVHVFLLRSGLHEVEVFPDEFNVEHWLL